MNALAVIVCCSLAVASPSEHNATASRDRWILGTGLAIGVPSLTLAVGTLNWWRLKADNVAADNFKWRDRGWFGENTYAGGHDKLGHFYSNYVAQYMTTALYAAAGFEPVESLWIGAGVVFLTSNLVEIIDGLTEYGFEYGDTVANVLGQLFAMASIHYDLDRYVQMRIGWVPSRNYFQPKVKQYQFLEDYDGQRFYLVANTAGILDAMATRLGPLRYVMPGFYYESRGYRPKTADPELRERNFGGVLAFDSAALLRDTWPASTWARATAMFAQFFQPNLVVGYGYDFNRKRWHAPDVSLVFSGRY